MLSQRKLQVIRQAGPVVVGSLLGVSFGTMLGWPSVAFVQMVDGKIAPIHISWDQTAMIAGFLMEGNILGTLFSSVRFLGSKTGVVLNCALQVAGWIAMYFANDIPGVGISRGLVGFGSGMGLGQLRIYAKETCEEEVFRTLMQYMPVGMSLGVVLVYSMGGLLSFRTLSLFCAMIPAANMFFFAAIPKKINDAEPESHVEAVTTIYQTKNLPGVTKTEKTEEHPVPDELGFIGCFKDRKIRISFLLLWFITTIPQHSGGAANIVYSQIVHLSARNPYPIACSIVYSIVFLMSNIFAMKYTNRFPRKPVLVSTCFICSLLLCSLCFYFYYVEYLLDISPLLSWSPLFLLSLFNFFHTVGINTIPMVVINDKFPKHARVTASKFYVMYFSLSAVISTKVFQVIFTYCGMHWTYVYVSSVAFASGIITLLFVKETIPSKTNLKLQGFYNDIDLNDEMPHGHIKKIDITVQTTHNETPTNTVQRNRL